MGLKDKKIMDREGVVRLLEVLSNHIREKGEIELSGTRIVLPEKVEVELEYKEKHGSNKFEIELKWEQRSTRPATEFISSENASQRRHADPELNSGVSASPEILKSLTPKPLNLLEGQGDNTVKIATLDELSPWKAIHFAYPPDAEDAILIVLPDRELRAYSTVCPHKGKCVSWDDRSKRLHCPAHGALFDPETGEKLKGPGDKSLKRIHLQIKEDSVFAVGIDEQR